MVNSLYSTSLTTSHNDTGAEYHTKEKQMTDPDLTSAFARCEAVTQQGTQCRRITTVRVFGVPICDQHDGVMLKYGSINLIGGRPVRFLHWRDGLRTM